MPARAQAGQNLFSFHGSTPDSLGVNPNEIVLTPSNVTASEFSLNFSTPVTDTPNIDGIPASVLNSSINYTAVDGQSFCEPLVQTGVSITTGVYQGVHDVVFVANELGSLYAIDANNGMVLWKDSFIYNVAGNPNPLNAAIPNGTTAIPGGLGTEENSSDISPWICIMGTPVIDSTNNVLYLIANTRYVVNGPSGDQANPHYLYTIHKINLSNGQDTSSVFAETILGYSNPGDPTYTFVSGPWVYGTGDYTTKVYFNAMRQMGRPALQLYNGRVYAAFASHGDMLPYHGWVLTFDTGSLSVNGAFCTTPNGSEGGIWQGGDSMVFDSGGYFYAMTGNGVFDTTLNGSGFPSEGDCGDSFIKLALDSTTTEGNQGSNLNGWGIKLVDYFTPSNQATLDLDDSDLSSGGTIILADSAGSTAHPHLMVGSGKLGMVYLVDRDNMGKFNSSTDNIVQEIPSLLSGCFSTPAYFNGRLYYSPISGSAVSWALTNGTLNTSTEQSSPDSSSYPGGPPYITASGTQSGIAWIMDKQTGQLRAYNAGNLATELWTSALNAGDALPGGTTKFAVPSPVNGRVYALSITSLCAYGPPPPVPLAPTGLTATAGNTQLSLTWAAGGEYATSYKVYRGTSPGGESTTAIATGVTTTTYTDTGLTNGTAYYYKVAAADKSGTSGLSNEATATPVSGGIPAAPTALTAAVGNTQLNLSWTTSVGATSYNVYRGLSAGGESATPIATGVTTTSYTNTGLTNGTIYYYTVTAVDSSGTSGYSNETNGTPIPPPSAPTGLTAAGGDAEVGLNWTAGSGAATYNVYRGISAGGESDTPIATGIVAAPYADTTVTNGTTYYYTVAAVNASGESGFSNEASATPAGIAGATKTYYQDSFNRMGELLGSTPTIDTNGNTWAVSTGTGGYSSNGSAAVISGSIYEFNVAYLPVNGSSGVTLDGTKDFTLSVGLTIGSAGQVGLNLSVSSDSGTLYGSSLAAVATGGFLGTYIFNQGGNSYNWGTAVSPTTVSLAYSAAAGTLTYTVGSTVLYTATGVTAAQVAALRSVAMGDQGYGGGAGAPSPTFNNFTLTVGVAPATPAGLTAASGTAAGQIALNWTSLSGAQEYILQRSTSPGSGYNTIATIAAPTVSYTDSSSSLVAGQNYYYEIAAADSSGTSAFGAYSSATPFVPASFSGWAYTWFGLNAPLSETADTANPANDGLSNLLKYALGLDPLVPASFQPTLSQSGATWKFTYQRPANRADISYTVQVSPDLSTWTTTGVTLSETGIGNPETWQATYTPGIGTKFFFRLQVTGP